MLIHASLAFNLSIAKTIVVSVLIIILRNGSRLSQLHAVLNAHTGMTSSFATITPGLYV